MGFEYTENQKKVLNARGHNVLVSAAAGSGKTAVLVERIVRMITEGEHPLDIDRLLVVTFTRAAAGEMRERIAKAVSEKLLEHPEDRHLQKQETLLHHAQITTIDSFCAYLLRNSFSSIDLDPGFRQMDETENALLEQDVMDRFLEEMYAEQNPDILTASEYFCQGVDDSKLPELIFSLLHTALSHPFGDTWLEERRKDYAVKDEEDLLSRAWMEDLLQREETLLEGVVSTYTAMENLCTMPGGPLAYLDTTGPEKEELEAILQKVKGSEKRARYDALREAADMNFASLKRIPRKDADSVDPDIQKRVKDLRDAAKSSIRELKTGIFADPLDIVVLRMQEMAPVMSAVLSLTISYHRMLQDKKKEKNVISFADLEQDALEILLERNADGTYTEKPEAVSYRQYFDEILIDEYQDSNEVQELLLGAIAGESLGRYARFMVGDVKQSIYRFRNARPEIFGAKLDTYTAGDTKTERIDLDQNFRSRTEVLNSVNTVFMKTMRREVGGVEYSDAVSLKKGADYPEAEEGPDDPYRTELLLVNTGNADSKGQEKELPAAAQEEGAPKAEPADDGADEIAALSARKKEALAVAKRIKELVENLYVEDKENGGQRKCTYRDIVILERSTTGNAAFREIFERENIPLYMDNRTGYFTAEEVREVLQMLRVIQNPRQDIPLYGVLRGYFGGFTEDEIARIRAIGNEKRRKETGENAKDGGENLLMDSLTAVINTAEDAYAPLRRKISDFMAFLDDWRDRAKVLPIHELLTGLISETGFDLYAAALPAGIQRKANLKELVVLAKGFEQTAYSGVFAFIRYIDQMHQYAVDQGEASILDEHADVVRIMTIHKSKGLEFPVCFVTGLSSKYAFSRDTSGPLIADSDLGIGADYVDLSTRSRTATLRKQAVAAKIKRDSLGEELRVLYVAMTRAKEKLILTAGVKDPEKLFGKEMTALSAFGAGKEEAHLPSDIIEGTGSFLDLLLVAFFARAQEVGEMPAIDMNISAVPVKISLTGTEDLSLLRKEEQMNLGARKDTLKAYQGMTNEQLPDSSLASRLSDRFAFRYPHEDLRNLYTKTSVSDLKHAAMVEKGLLGEPESEGAEEMFPDSSDIYEPVYIRLDEDAAKKEESGKDEGGKEKDREDGSAPESAGNYRTRPDTERDGSRDALESDTQADTKKKTPGAEKEAGSGRFQIEKSAEKGYKEEENGTVVLPVLTGAARGTAIHRGCELINYHVWKNPSEVTKEEFKKFVQRIRMEGKIPPEYETVLLPVTFLPFLKSKVAARMAKAAQTGHLKREQPFVYGLPADKVDPQFSSREMIMIQGIIDAFFIERGEDGTTHAVVVDYKTDRVKTGQELIDLYKTQLDLYAEALEGMFRIPVTEKIIYSFTLQEEIVLP